MTKYIIHKTKPFTGSVENSITNSNIVDYSGGQTFEEWNAERGNQYKVITDKELDELQAIQRTSLIGKWEEITEDRYYDLMGCVPPARMSSGYFAVGECYTMDLYSFCVEFKDKFYKSLQPIRIKENDLRISITNHVINSLESKNTKTYCD